ncbi:MAG: CoA pyrophosphatase [Pseudomonadota bacterium]
MAGDVNSLEALLQLEGAPSSDFDLNKDVRLPEGRKLRPAAVLLGVEGEGASATVLLTKRSSRLKHHPGQIALPGGKVDEGDAGTIGAALREAQEEIGMPMPVAQILGTLPPHETVTGYLVTPVVARITGSFPFQPEPGEVDEVFRVPFSHLMDASRYRVEARNWQGRPRRFYAVPYGPYYIWGATARIFRSLADRAAQL